MVLSIVILLFWQARTMPPRQEGPSCPVGAGGSCTESMLSVTFLSAPVSVLISLVYWFAASCKHFFTKGASLALQRTATLSSNNINRPWTMRLVMKGAEELSLT